MSSCAIIIFIIIVDFGFGWYFLSRELSSAHQSRPKFSGFSGTEEVQATNSDSGPQSHRPITPSMVYTFVPVCLNFSTHILQRRRRIGKGSDLSFSLSFFLFQSSNSNLRDFFGPTPTRRLRLTWLLSSGKKDEKVIVLKVGGRYCTYSSAPLSYKDKIPRSRISECLPPSLGYEGTTEKRKKELIDSLISSRPGKWFFFRLILETVRHIILRPAMSHRFVIWLIQ